MLMLRMMYITWALRTFKTIGIFHVSCVYWDWVIVWSIDLIDLYNSFFHVSQDCFLYTDDILDLDFNFDWYAIQPQLYLFQLCGYSQFTYPSSFFISRFKLILSVTVLKPFSYIGVCDLDLVRIYPRYNPNLRLRVLYLNNNFLSNQNARSETVFLL